MILNSDRTGLILDTDMPMAMVNDVLAIKTKSGKTVFGWGGHYRNHKDAMHFEIRDAVTPMVRL